MKKNNSKIIVCILVILSFLSGCAPAPHRIKPTYVSSLQYQGYSCAQIRQESSRVQQMIFEVEAHQQNEAQKDTLAVMNALNPVLLGIPILLLLVGKDKQDELARLKGEYEALQSMATQKKCYSDPDPDS